MIKKYQFFKESILNNINKSDLDIGAIYFILKDIFKEVEIMYYTQINNELIEDSENKIKE